MKFHFPQIHMPEIHVPKIHIPQIHVPQIHVPKINLPQIHTDVHVPKINVPQIHVPQIHVPQINIPKVNLPQIHIPQLKPLPKPSINMPALQKSIGYITDIISVVPIVRPIVTGLKIGLNVATHGESSKYLKDDQKSNSSWNMAPGGSLFQRILNDSTNGKSGDWISRHTIDPVKIVTEKVNNLPPKYNPTQILHHSEGNGNGNSTLFRHTMSRNIIKPPLFELPTNQLYSPPSTIQIKDPVLVQNKSYIPKPNILPVYTPIFNEKIPIIDPIIQIKEPVSTLQLSTQHQVVVPIVDNTFNQLQTNNVKIESIKHKNVDMTIPFISLAGILLIMIIRR